MVETQFSAILNDLGAILNCKLEPDTNNSCLVAFGSGLQVQLELDRENNLVVGARLGTIAPSKYRENVFREALRSNEMNQLSLGTFGFSRGSNQLILFTTIDARNVNNQEFLGVVIKAFLAKANEWRDAIERGDVPVAKSALIE